MVFFASDCLPLDVELEAVYLIVICVERCGEVNNLEQSVLQHHLDTCAQVLSHVHRCLVHQAIALALIPYALHHVGCRTIVCR